MEEMAGYEVHGPTEEEMWRLWRVVSSVTNSLSAQGIPRTPAIVADVCEQRGHPVTISRIGDHFYLIKPKED